MGGGHTGRVINLILPIAVGYLQGCSNVHMLIRRARSDFMIDSHQKFCPLVRWRKCGWLDKQDAPPVEVVAAVAAGRGASAVPSRGAGIYPPLFLSARLFCTQRLRFNFEIKISEINRT